jgi:hypothetical protein
LVALVARAANAPSHRLPAAGTATGLLIALQRAIHAFCTEALAVFYSWPLASVYTVQCVRRLWAMHLL